MATPKYIEIIKDITLKINSEEYKINDKLPSLKEMCNIYNTSQITIRRVFNELEETGLISKTQGKQPVVISSKNKNVSPYISLFGQKLVLNSNYSMYTSEEIAKQIITRASNNNINIELRLDYLSIELKMTKFKANHIGGIIFNLNEFDLEYINISKIKNNNLIVLNTDIIKNQNINFITCNEKEEIFKYLNKIIKYNNFTKIFMITGYDTYSNKLRNSGYKKALLHNNLDLKKNKIFKLKGLKYSSHSENFRHPYDITKELIKKNNLPELFVTSGGVRALGVITALKEAKIKIPQEVSVLNLFSLQIDTLKQIPNITSLYHPKKEFSDLAYDYLYSGLKTNKYNKLQKYLNVKFKTGNTLINSKNIEALMKEN